MAECLEVSDQKLLRKLRSHHPRTEGSLGSVGGPPRNQGRPDSRALPAIWSQVLKVLGSGRHFSCHHDNVISTSVTLLPKPSS